MGPAASVSQRQVAGPDTVQRRQGLLTSRSHQEAWLLAPAQDFLCDLGKILNLSGLCFPRVKGIGKKSNPRLTSLLGLTHLPQTVGKPI